MPFQKILCSSLFLLFSLLSPLLQAQTNQLSSNEKQISVSGHLSDSLSHDAIAFASVMLKNVASGREFVQNTDSIGRFYFSTIPLGKYVFKAFYVGYPQIAQNVRIFSLGNSQDLGTVFMKRQSNVLNEISVTDYKDLIEQRPDGIVYLAGKDATNKGASADEVLRKVPMVTVDMDDNLALRGNGNVRVLIDGKPSTMIASNVSDVLKQIPADNIKSIEVVTSPGAKYDAEGSAGVINIVTKQSFIKGISGRVYSGLSYNLVDQQMKGHGGINLNYRHNKLGISAELGGGHWSHTSEQYATRTDHPGAANEAILNQTTLKEGGGSFVWGRISGDYTIDSLNSVSVGLGFNPGNWKRDESQTTHFPDYGLNYFQNTKSSSPDQDYSVNAAYNKKFRDNPQHRLDFLALYSVNRDHDQYDLDKNYLPEDTFSYQEKSANLTKNKEFTFQADYARPLKRFHQKIETGLKYINRNVFSDYDLFSRNSNAGEEWTPNLSRTNLLEYTQQVAAAYAQFSTNLTPKLSLITGLRYEFTGINGKLRDNGGGFHSQFNNVLPSAIFSYKLRQFDRLNLSYTQRIERPSIRYINPYIDYSDPLNITMGNPELSPERIHKVELNYSTMFGGSSLNVATFYSHTQNGIEAWTSIENNGVALTTYGNYALNNTMGLNLFGGTVLFKRWRLNLNGNLYHKALSGNDMDNSGWQYDAHFTSTVDISNGFAISGFAMYRGREIMLQGYRSGWYRYSLGVKKDILKGRGDVSLTVENFLSPDIKSLQHYNYGDAVYDMTSYRHARGLRFSFTYNFGRMKFDKDRKKIDNNDLKGGQNEGDGANMG